MFHRYRPNTYTYSFEACMAQFWRTGLWFYPTSDGTGLGTQRVPQETCGKNAGKCTYRPRRLKSHTGGGISLCHRKHINPWLPARSLPYKVIFTHISACSTSTGTCGPHPSQMEVIVQENLTPAGIIHGASMLCPNPEGASNVDLTPPRGTHPLSNLQMTKWEFAKNVCRL